MTGAVHIRKAPTMMTPTTKAQADQMRLTVRQRSDSYIQFALQVARITNDLLAVELYEAEQTRRYAADILAIVAPLDAIPEWKD